MSKNKTLFLFAAYDKDNIIDDALVYYVSQLSKHGDVIVCLDCDAKKSETDKLKKYTLTTIAKRHGEYDFGSYKRAYQYARDKNILDKYDFVYLVNDSVFGPMFDIKKTLSKCQDAETDAISMIVATHKTHSYMESWFVRLNRKIFLSDWFDNFISDIHTQPTKNQVTIKYEHGLSNLIKNNNCSWSGLYTYRGRFTYNRPKFLFQHGCPFIKKASFTRHNGEHGKQIKYILSHADKKPTDAVMKTATRLYGKDYMNWFFTSCSIKIFIRKIQYAFKKIRKN